MTNTDSGASTPEAEIAALQRRLEAEEERRRSRERELVEQTARTRDAEARLDAVRQTMAFGLGQALVDALKLPGLVRLPARVLELRRRQKEKRGWQTTHQVEQRPAEEMRLVRPALTRAEAEGSAAAADWVEGRPRRFQRAKARALGELALREAAAMPDQAVALARRALALNPQERRVASVALRLHDTGALAAPAALLGALAPEALTGGLRQVRDEIAGEADLLARGLVLPARRAAPAAGDAAAVLVAHSQPWDDDAIARRAMPAAGETIVITPPGYAAEGEGPEPSDGPYLRLPPLEDAPVPLAAFVEAVAPLYAERLLASAVRTVRVVLGDVRCDAAAVAGARLAGAEVVLDIGWLPGALFAADSEVGRAAEAWLRAMLAAADRLVVRGAALAERVAAYGGPAPTIASDDPVAAPVLSEEAARELRRSFRWPEGPVVFACPATLDDDPGLVTLIEAVAGLPDVAVLFCGTGSGMPLLARHAALAAAGERVLFSGALPPAQRQAALALAAGIVLPKQRPAAIVTDRTGQIALAAALGPPLLVSEPCWRWRTIADGAAPAPRLFGDAAELRARLAEVAAATLRPGPGDVSALAPIPGVM